MREDSSIIPSSGAAENKDTVLNFRRI